MPLTFWVDPRIAEVWPLGGVGFVLLTLVWDAPRRTRVVVPVAMVVVGAVTAVALGRPPAYAVWFAVVAVLQSWSMATAYRWARRAPGWATRHAWRRPGTPVACARRSTAAVLLWQIRASASNVLLESARSSAPTS